jgi:hypothetical protein
MRIRKLAKLRFADILILATAVIAVATGSAESSVIISTAATKHMVCAAGLCAPTRIDAVLNASDLETMLASGNVEVTTTNPGNAEATNMDVRAALALNGASTLSLAARQSVTVSAPISVGGPGGLSFTTDNGGTGGELTFGPNASASFANLSSPLTINGVSYTLVNSIASLANAVEANTAGNYALAVSYDASADGNYRLDPMNHVDGTIEGLGNTISNFSLQHNAGGGSVYWGLIGEIGVGGIVANLKLTKLHYKLNAKPRNKPAIIVGGLVGVNESTVYNDYASGTILAGSVVAGGLVGLSGGLIASSSANVNVRSNSVAGGLIGLVDGTLNECYASGRVSAPTSGGLVGIDRDGSIMKSYGTGEVTGDGTSAVGGLVGQIVTGARIADSYASGAVAGGQANALGGLVGEYESSTLADNYWDTTDDGVGGGNVSGITGLTDMQFRAGLPVGFDPAIWAQKKSVNKGLPYLIANPPPTK